MCSLSTPKMESAGAHSNEHRDPFDRLLAAQADLEKAVRVTLDPVFAGFQ